MICGWVVPPFKRFLRQNAHGISSYWTNKTALNRLGFSSEKMDEFSTEEIFTCFTLLRVCIEDIDIHIARSIKDNELINYVTKNILSQIHLKYRKEVLYRKVRQNLKDQFSKELDHSAIKMTISVSKIIDI